MQFLLFLVIIVSLGVQFSSYINSDNGWLLYAAAKALDGAKLNYDIIENNPPLIIYLYMIPVLIGEFVGASAMQVFVGFVSVLALFSLYLASKPSDDKYLWLTAGFAIFFLIAGDFGQREHLTIIFILPFMMQLITQKQCSKSFILISSIMAAIGFAVKPYYILLWVAMVLIDTIYSKNLTRIFTIQNWLIGGIIFVYSLYVIFIYEGYLSEVFPFVREYYFGFDNGKENEIYAITAMQFIIYQLPLIYVFLLNRKVVDKKIITYSILHFVCLLVAVMQLKGWANHIYPAVFFAFLLNSSLLIIISRDLKIFHNKIIAALLVVVLMNLISVGVKANINEVFSAKSKVQEKVNFLNDHAAGKKFMTWSFNLPSLSPAFIYSDNADYVSRYGHFWQIPGMYNRSEVDQETKQIKYHNLGDRSELEAKFMRGIASDFVNNRPDVVFIIECYPNYCKTNHLGEFALNFVEYFSQEEDFKRAWKNYKLVYENEGKKVYVNKR